jgi:hypothetical protein
MYEPTSEQIARAFSRAVFVDGEISLGDFMTRLAEYGDARVREARARAEALSASAGRVVTTTGDAREAAIGALRVDLERWSGTRDCAPTS